MFALYLEVEEWKLREFKGGFYFLLKGSDHLPKLSVLRK